MHLSVQPPSVGDSAVVKELLLQRGWDQAPGVGLAQAEAGMSSRGAFLAELAWYLWVGTLESTGACAHGVTHGMESWNCFGWTLKVNESNQNLTLPSLAN